MLIFGFFFVTFFGSSAVGVKISVESVSKALVQRKKKKTARLPVANEKNMSRETSTFVYSLYSTSPRLIFCAQNFCLNPCQPTSLSSYLLSLPLRERVLPESDRTSGRVEIIRPPVVIKNVADGFFTAFVRSSLSSSHWSLSHNLSQITLVKYWYLCWIIWNS